MHLFTRLQRQCRRSRCLHHLSELSLLCFCKAYIIIAVIVSLVWPYASCISSIFSQCMDSRSMNNCIASRFFARTPLKIQYIVRICEFLDWFLWQPFWFFPHIFSTSLWYIWEALYYKSLRPCKSHQFQGCFSWGSRLLSIFQLRFNYTLRSMIEAVCQQIFLSSILLEVFHRSQYLFWI